jgi:hypothetical protein
MKRVMFRRPAKSYAPGVGSCRFHGTYVVTEEHAHAHKMV